MGLVTWTPATHFACYVGVICDACLFRLRVILGSCANNVGFMCESCFFPRTSTTNGAIRVGFMRESYWD